LRSAPFLLEPVLKPKCWGGRSLERLFNRVLPAGEVIGESWELCARQDASSAIAGGPMAGRTLLEAIEEDPAGMLGEAVVSAYNGCLPVMAKFIDAAEWLSIQVHPDDCMARNLGESDSGKEEVWLVVDARPGASLILGAKQEVPFDRVVELCERGRYAECLNYVQVEAGDVIEVPPGTLHAIGKGIVLLEVSQSSDLTYRIHDWKRRRPGRELHIGKARESFVCKPPIGVKRILPRENLLAPVHVGRYFRLFTLRAIGGAVALREAEFASVTVLEGSVSLAANDSALEIKAGCTAFVPASSPTVQVRGEGIAAIVGPAPSMPSAPRT
jgi:mannose-6-phosphate isomerase